ncbi:hypothetical protein SCUCBS95973_006431 [Sporothrix curviconia]|uniref:Rhodopsin domain-containing protein n=1 Tax=Sporothrix curviconia TaxID=1260050 RepID=A0ABP0C5C9_9PEZI
MAFVVFPTKGYVLAQFIVNCVIGLVAYIVVALRIYGRININKARLGLDDIMILVAVPQGLAMIVITGLYTRLGIGYDVTETLANLPLILRLLVAYEILYATCNYSVKLSVLFFYQRVFINRGMRIATIVTMVFVSLWTLGNILQIFLLCRPFRASIDPTVPGTCGSQKASFVAIGTFNIVTDAVILSLPIPTVWRLQTTTRNKALISGVFLVGLLVSVVAICRIVAILHLNTLNLTGTAAYGEFLTAVEPNLGILCVSLPGLRVLWSRVRGTYANNRSSGAASAALGGVGGSASADKKFRIRLDDDNSGSSGSGSGSGSKSNSSSYALEPIVYDARHPETRFTTSIVRPKNASDSSSQDGSETELAPGESNAGTDMGKSSKRRSERRAPNGIVIKTELQTQWATARGSL